MGMQRLSLAEDRALHVMLTAKYRGGQDPDTLADDAASYLRARGWKEHPANRRANEAAQRAIADVDGVAGDVP